MIQEDGVNVYRALWTCMTGFYLRSQLLAMTKGHEERLLALMGIAASARQFGHDDPDVVHSDDPVKVNHNVRQ